MQRSSLPPRIQVPEKENRTKTIKPDTDELIQRHIATILEDEIRDALPDTWQLTSCRYKPKTHPMIETINSISVARGARQQPEFECHFQSNSGRSISKIYYFVEHKTIKDMVSAINYSLQLPIPGTTYIDPQQVIEKRFNDLILVMPIKPKRNALFITGPDPLLGAGKTAQRLSFNQTKNHWRFFVPHDVKAAEIEIYKGKRELGKEVDVLKLKWVAKGKLPIEVSEKPAEAPIAGLKL